MYVFACFCLLGLLYVSKSVNSEGYPRIETKETNPVERALQYVFKERNASCVVGTEEILPLEFDHSVWSEYTDPAIRTANLLSKFLKLNNGTLDEVNEELFFLFVRNNVHGDSLIFGSAIALERGVYSKYDIFCPYAYKLNHSVKSHDLSVNYDYLDPSTEWYNSVKTKSWENVTIATDGVMYRENNSLLPEVEEVYPVAELKDGHWTYPYYDCGGGNIWMVTYSSPIFSIFNDTVFFRGVATIDIELQNIDINQCDPDNKEPRTALDVFRGTHKCQPTTKCVPVTGLGFVTGAYNCWCVEGYFYPVVGGLYFTGRELETFFQEGRILRPDMFRCVVCAPGCDDCVDHAPCLYQRDRGLLLVLMVLMILIILGIAVLAALTYYFRTEMVFKSASPIFLQLMCLGGGIACFKFFFLYPQTTRLTCVLRMWPMHTGFIIMYGSLIVKTWRVSVIFTVGTKKRVRLPDRKLLKRIGLITLASTASLAAWTGINPPQLRVYESDNGLKFVTCDYGSWEYVILAGKHDSLYCRVWKIYRVPAKKRVHIPDRKVLERLGLITLSSTAGVAAWTSISPPQLRVYDSDNGLKFVTCGNGSWEHAIIGAEIVFLLYGVYLCFTVRKAPAQFNESRHITWAVYNAIILGSFMAFTSSFIEPLIGPNLSLVLKFIQIQVYVTFTLALIFVPKFYKLYKKVDIGANVNSPLNGGFQTVTGRVKMSQIAPRPPLVPKISTASQTADTSTTYEDVSSSKRASIFLPFPRNASQNSLASCNRYTNMEASRTIANSLLPFVEGLANREPTQARQRANSSIIDRRSVEVPTRSNMNSFPSLDDSDSNETMSTRDKDRSNSLDTKTAKPPVKFKW